MTQAAMVGGMGERDLEQLAGAGSWTWTVREDRIDWSPELSRIYGLDPGDAPAGYEAFLELVHTDDRELTREAVERAFRDRRGLEYRHRIVRADGDVRTLWSLVRVDTDDDGAVIRLRGACQDITDRLELERRLSRAQALATAGYVAAGLAHDLNNLLGVVVFLSDAASRRGTAAGKAGLLEQLQEVARRAAQMSTRIQKLASGGEVDGAATADLGQSLEKLASVLHSVVPRGVETVVDVRDSVPPVAMDPFDLERVLWNLVVNAVHAQPRGGEIRLSCDRVVDGGRAFGRVVVADAGEGLAPDAANRVFHRFYTSKGRGGTGLGLAIVADIVEASGGHVTVDSEPGVGTRFAVHIPLAG